MWECVHEFGFFSCLVFTKILVSVEKFSCRNILYKFPVFVLLADLLSIVTHISIYIYIHIVATKIIRQASINFFTVYI